MANILAVLEQRDGTLRKVSYETVTAARLLADTMGATVDALVLGAGSVSGVDQVATYGADRVLTADHQSFGLYQPDGFAATVAAAAEGCTAVVFGATATGKDLAPRVAAKLGVGYAAEIIGCTVDGDHLVATRPVYAGKALQKIRLAGSPAVLSVRPNTVPLAELPKAGTVESIAIPDFETRVTVTEVKAPANAALDVAEAPIVVAGGRGLREPEHFKLIEDLAAAFGDAAVGSSRAVVDAGWRDHSSQVGQTGKTVSPNLYVAVGISGAIQHLAGMRTAKTIVAINKDADAPIFKVADYGIVGDLFEVVPRLTEEVKKARAEG
jgi:electron transfer flavoprotein alpha subunit